MTAAIGVRQESVKWDCRTILRKFEGDVDDYRRRLGKALGEEQFDVKEQPFEERVIEGNLLLDEGVECLFKLMAGLTATAYSEANARLGVGDTATPAAERTQTDLQAPTNKLYKAMDTGYPVVGATAAHKITFRSSFGAGDANFAWEEWSVDNGATAHLSINRKVESLGTKAGGTWQLTIEISLS